MPSTFPFSSPTIDPRIFHLAPEFRMLSIMVEAAPITQPDIADQALKNACKSLTGQDVPWAEAHIAAWDDVFTRFGANPKRTPCSVQALRKRVLRDGNIPSIDPVVDLYNAISIQYAIPVGGENIAAYVGNPKLTIADGTESFDTMKNGEPANEPPKSGEIIWRDDLGVTCRCWNWRQGVRTRLDSNAKHMWFIFDSLPAMPLTALNEAGDKLIEGLQQMMPGAKTQKELMSSPPL